MTPDETAKRLAEIRNQLWIKHPDEWPESTVLWLLDLLAASDARIAKLTAALQEIAGCKNDSRIEETPWIAEEALKP